MAEPKDSGDLDLWHSKIEDSEYNKIHEQIFERLYSAEIHYNRDSKYDIPSAAIGFDNAIELSFACYLPPDEVLARDLKFDELAPFFFKDEILTSSGIQYFYDNISQKLKKFASYRGENYTKNDKTANLSDYIIYLHKLRNEHYHRLDSSMLHEFVQYDKLLKIDDPYILDDIRVLAIWVLTITFGLNYEDIETKLTKRISEDKQISNPFTLIDQQGFKHDSYATNPALLDAFLLGKWDDGNPDDLKIISGFTNE